MKLPRTDSHLSVPADSVQPETIQARSYHWPDIQLLIRSRTPGFLSLPHGQREHMLFCKWILPEADRSVHSIVKADSKRLEWTELPDRLVTFVPAGYPFEWEWTYNAKSIHLLLPPCALVRVAEDITSDHGRIGELLPQFCIPDPLIALMLERLQGELQGDGYGTSLAIEAITSLLSVHLLRIFTDRKTHPLPERGGLSPKQKPRVLSLIDARLDENIPLQELADTAGLSRYHFSRMFKQSFGMPPHEYQVQKRVDRARDLLRFSQDRSIPEIALSLGFNDESHFRRHFKRLSGVTPAEYRRQQKR